MKNIICVPFAFENGVNSGVNLKKNNKTEIYLKNASVALISAKWNNPTCDIVFATNISVDELPLKFTELLRRNKIQIIIVEYTDYKFPSDYKWALAFYKLCVLKHMIQMGFQNCCYMDTDVYVQGSFDDIWRECKHSILLYDINHGLGVKEYRDIISEMNQFCKNDLLLTHYGGEFFAANYENAVVFEREMSLIYKEMLEKNFITTKGDEFIVSIAADKCKKLIKNASPYICRFWTGASFRLTSTCYEYNAVSVLHMPAEKEKGIIKIYDKYISKNQIPDNSKIWNICRLKRMRLIEAVYVKVRKVVKRGNL